MYLVSDYNTIFIREQMPLVSGVKKRRLYTWYQKGAVYDEILIVGYLDDGLKLTRISQRVLDDHLANVLLVASILRALGVREEDLAVADDPAPVAREVDDGALGVEK